jgi:hypothetical protein
VGIVLLMATELSFIVRYRSIRERLGGSLLSRAAP